MAVSELEKTIGSLVETAVEAYAEGFQAQHDAEVDNPEGIINMKIHNVFIEALGEEIRYYAALVRLLDSSLGNMFQSLAINIAKSQFEVHRNVEGPLTLSQTRMIAELLEQYKRHKRTPGVEDYQDLRSKKQDFGASTKRHDSDYYLIDRKIYSHYLIELKIGGDLDNKKARSEKEALLEQFATLSIVLPAETELKIMFATAYNRYGEDKPWRQQRVRQYFADEELLIGKNFWNFVWRSDEGHKTVIEAYRICKLPISFVCSLFRSGSSTSEIFRRVSSEIRIPV